MLRFLTFRFLSFAVVMVIMSFVFYGLIAAMPGDPLDIMLASDPHMTAEDVAQRKAAEGLDKPFLERYANWAKRVLTQGDFGYARFDVKPVFDVIIPRLKNTIRLMSVAFIIAVLIGIPLGVFAATRPRSVSDYSINLFCFAGISTPSFFLCLILIIVFAVKLHWFPAGGSQTIGTDFNFFDRLYYIVLPATALTILSIATYTRFMRSSMIEVLRSDFIRTARAKGASQQRVIWRHAFRNGIIPVVTIMALDFGAFFSGTVVTETVFSYPGIGRLIYDSINGNDYNTALATLLTATFVILIANFIADILYTILDPRISYHAYA